MFSTEPPSVRQLSSSPRANEETANLCFATMAFSSSSFRSFFAAWDTNALGEVLQLVEIPIAVLEVAQRHHQREGVGHAATAYLFRRRRSRVLALRSRSLQDGLTIERDSPS